MEDLNAIRYQLDGTGYRERKSAPKVTVGCPDNVCKGYELMRDLDFKDDASYSSISNKAIWTTGSGWQPIIADYYSDSFRSTFMGNNYTISNLRIKRLKTNFVGLFSRAKESSRINNIGLLNVDIKGNGYVGGLVAGMTTAAS